MSDASWRFVSEISADASTVLNLHDGAPFWVSSWDAPPPDMIVSSAQSALVDGSLRTAESFGDRILTLRVDLQTASADLTAAAFQRLARALLAPQWLRFQPPSSSRPVFFRTKPCTPAQVEEYRLLAERNKEIQIEIPADPWAHGLKESASLSLPNDPVDSGMRFTLPAAKGDVPAPLRLECQFHSPTERVLIGSSPTGIVQGVPAWLPPNSPEFFNGLASGWTIEYVTDSSATGELRHAAKVRTQGADGWLAVPARVTFPQVTPGDYRVLVRMRMTRPSGDVPSTGDYIVRGFTALPDWPGATWSDAYWNLYEQRPIPWGNGFWQWVDLGVMRLPGRSRMASVFDAAPKADAKVRFLVNVSGLAPSQIAEVSLDHAVLVPAPGADGADGRLMVAAWNLGSVSAQSNLTISEESGAYTDVDGGASLGWSALGGFPRALPGRATTITVVPRLNQGGDSKSVSTKITWSYFPRYLYLRGD